MKLAYMKCILFLVVLLSSSIWGYAAEIDFKCSECHDKVEEILPQSHIKKKSFDGCFTCHKDGGKIDSLREKVHTQHLADMGTDKEICLSCHVGTSEGEIIVNEKENKKVYLDEAVTAFTSYYTNGTLANSHKNVGLNCTDCHTTYDYDELDTISKKCITCHDGHFEIVKISDLQKHEEVVPHKSHFEDLACTKCHSVHYEFKDFCAGCHKWDFKWKQKIIE